MLMAFARILKKRAVMRWWPVLLLISPSWGAALESSEVLALATPSLVLVQAKKAQGDAGLVASGVVIRPQQVITSCAMVQGGAGYEVQSGGRGYPATLVLADTEKELCLLEVKDLAAPPAQRGSSAGLAMQMSIWSVAMREGKAAIEEGVVIQLRGGQPPLIETTNLGNPTSVGGGLYNSEGQLVGIATRFYEAGRETYFTAPVEWLDQLSTAPVTPGRLHWLKRAMALEGTEQWQPLRDLSRQWSAAYPADASAWHTLGYSCIVLHDLAGALAAFEQTVRINPADLDGWSNLGYVYTDLERFPEAIRSYREVVRINPQDTEGWSNLAMAYDASGEEAEATKAVEALRQLDAGKAQEVMQHLQQ